MKRRNLIDVLNSFQKAGSSESEDLTARLRQAAADTPAYRSFLLANGIEPDSIMTIPWADLPVLSKQNYVLVHPIVDRCHLGSLAEVDTFAVSSGTTGKPTVWPRSLVDELDSSLPYELVSRSFEADRLRTLMVVAFPLGIWIGGMHATSTLRLLSANGFPISVVSPGANPDEIVRAVSELSAYFDQVVLLGYPPFLRDVLASKPPDSLWTKVSPRLIMAGEAFTEEWRDRIHTLAGREDPFNSSAAVYGTADAGVLAFESSLSIRIRRLASKSPELCEQLFGERRLPALMQYSGAMVHFEQHERSLLFSKLGVMPLVRYSIGDIGGVYTPDELAERLQEFCSGGLVDCPIELIREIQGSPYSFVYLFGRSDSTVSFFGAKIYAEHISTAINTAPASDRLTGRFYMETFDDQLGQKKLRVVVEMRGEETLDGDDAEVLRQHIQETLLNLNSEFKNYVPPAGHQIVLKLVPFESEALFSRKGKQKYSNPAHEEEEA